MTDEVAALVVYRLQQAGEALDAASLLLVNGKLGASVNRSYYAMFYSVLALLAVSGEGTSKHAGAVAGFDRFFVKPGHFSKDFSHWFHAAFDLRQRADYRELFVVVQADAQEMLTHAKAFVEAVREHLRREANLSGQ